MHLVHIQSSEPLVFVGNCLTFDVSNALTNMFKVKYIVMCGKEASRKCHACASVMRLRGDPPPIEA